MTPQEYIDRERRRALTNLDRADERRDKKAAERLVEKLEVLLEIERGLKPTVTREQVEKAWKGDSVEKCDPYHLFVWAVCSRCGYDFEDGWPENFCPKCGTAFTDEAVDIVMERIKEGLV